MDLIQIIKEWLLEHPTAFSVIKYVLWLLVVLITISVLRRSIKRRFPETDIRYKAQKGVEIVGYVVIILLSISYFTGSIRDFTLVIGLLTAGITITLQELILGIAGSFYIFFVKVYKPGDRIEINGIKGDVIDMDSMYTTMMEIGEWVGSDNYSGRIIKLSNAFVFKGPIYNYSKDFPFVWDEFNIPVRYGSDVKLAKEIILGVASEELSDFIKASMNRWSAVVSKYYIEDAKVEPSIAMTMTDNWIDFNLRYIVDYKERRSVKHNLNEKIYNKLMASNGKVELASTTIEIVRVPKIDVDAGLDKR